MWLYGIIFEICLIQQQWNCNARYLQFEHTYHDALEGFCAQFSIVVFEAWLAISLPSRTVFTVSKIISCSLAWCYGTLDSCGNLWKIFSKLQSDSYIPKTGHSGFVAHTLFTSDPPHALIQLLHDKLLIKHVGVDVTLQRCSARFSVGITVILTEIFGGFPR